MPVCGPQDAQPVAVRAEVLVLLRSGQRQERDQRPDKRRSTSGEWVDDGLHRSAQRVCLRDPAEDQAHPEEPQGEEAQPPVAAVSAATSAASSAASSAAASAVASAAASPAESSDCSSAESSEFSPLLPSSVGSDVALVECYTLETVMTL